MQTFLLYMPVYHQGHSKLFAKYPQTKSLILLSAEWLREFAPTHKDLHGLDVLQMQKLMNGLQRFDEVRVMTDEILKEIRDDEVTIIVPTDEAVQKWLTKYAPNLKTIEEDIFLRWDKSQALAEKPLKTTQILNQIQNDGNASKTALKLQNDSSFSPNAKMVDLLALASQEGQKSSDWWRKVGCVLLTVQGEQLLAHNTHLPEAQTPYILGDVRAQFHKGEQFELTTAIHAEAKVIGEAARRGLATAGATLIVTDFPCPVCAKLIGQAGIKKVYFQKGYGMLDGEEILQSFGVEVVKI